MNVKSISFYSIIVWMTGILMACQSEYSNHPAYNSLTYDEKVKLKQYVIQGKTLYEVHCQSCHQEDGSGLGRLIPPISESAYVKEHNVGVACMIRNGLKGEWVSNGITYDGVMPPNYRLTHLEIAEIITFIGNSWNNKIGLISASDVEIAFSKCN